MDLWIGVRKCSNDSHRAGRCPKAITERTLDSVLVVAEPPLIIGDDEDRIAPSSKYRGRAIIKSSGTQSAHAAQSRQASIHTDVPSPQRCQYRTACQPVGT